MKKGYNRTFARLRHLTTTTRIHHVVPFWCKLEFLLFKPHGIAKFKYEKKNEMNSGSCSQMRSSWKCAICLELNNADLAGSALSLVSSSGFTLFCELTNTGKTVHVSSTSNQPVRQINQEHLEVFTSTAGTLEYATNPFFATYKCVKLERKTNKQTNKQTNRRTFTRQETYNKIGERGTTQLRM